MNYDDDNWTAEEVALAETGIVAANLDGEWNFHVSDGIDQEDLWEGVCLKNVNNVETVEDGEFIVEGYFKTVEAVGRIPAGPNRGYGPINPPEVITEDVGVQFFIHVSIDDDLMATVEIEAY
ncbi:hypothetical protein JMJ58_19455 [Haloterrigena salifodinae]|uniref:Uncharacterized protein n=1 Tax=Haloterrigena salifodinae TaxID=2675099 RepID=A0A8T8DZP5_9EURY|nr:hypothetical protein [Haloterrigena salifodinae]QRV15058.1 hypothetical protein JMJ58_19455 [Haloterrigena salifodinae]